MVLAMEADEFVVLRGSPASDAPRNLGSAPLADRRVEGPGRSVLADGGAGRRGVLDLCFVESGAREVGLGHLLLDEALGWFRDAGCTGVDGTAYPGDRGAKNFFESAGFKARLLVMHRPLD